MEYLGIIIDDKFKFSDHVRYAAERSTKLIQILSKLANISWGIKHGAMKTIYKAAVLPILLYGAPVWIEALQHEHNRLKFIRVQKLMSIRVAKKFCTSSEALCILTAITPIIIKTQDAVQKYIVRKGKGSHTHLTAKSNSRIGHTRQV